MTGVPGVVSSWRHRAMLYRKERVIRLMRQTRVAGGILILGTMVGRSFAAARERRPQAVVKPKSCRVFGQGGGGGGWQEAVDWAL